MLDFLRQTSHSGVRRVWLDILFLWSPTEDFLSHKFEDHRHVTAGIWLLYGPIAALLWVHDFIVDPAGAQQTILLRTSYLGLLALPFAFLAWSHPRQLAIASLATLFIVAEVFIEILTRLHDGMVYGLGGFMFFQIIAISSFQCFSLRWNFGFALGIALLPHLLALAGLAPGFLHANYGVLIWPAALGTLGIQLAMAIGYLRRYESERHLEKMSITDPLTGINNRRFFMSALATDMHRVRRQNFKISVLMLDIDFFKRINDTYGHPVGDIVLCKLAELCIHTTRNSDCVARIGGEEFAILLRGAALIEAGEMAERLRDLVERSPITWQGISPFQITVSIGVAEMKETDQDETSLMERADSALYEAKRTGRNRVRLNGE